MDKQNKKRILLVDDDSVVLRTIREGLSDRYKVFGANSGTNALKILEKQAVDLVLLDYEMPQMNGPAVLEAIRAHPARGETPVMFLTGKEDITERISGLQTAGCLSKALPLPELSARLDAFFAA